MFFSPSKMLLAVIAACGLRFWSVQSHVQCTITCGPVASFAEKRTTLKKIISLTSQSIRSPYFWITPGNPLNLYIKLE